MKRWIETRTRFGSVHLNNPGNQITAVNFRGETPNKCEKLSTTGVHDERIRTLFALSGA